MDEIAMAKAPIQTGFIFIQTVHLPLNHCFLFGKTTKRLSSAIATDAKMLI